MTEALVAETLVAMNKLRSAMEELNNLWLEHEELNFLGNEYPFDHNFSELTFEVGAWYDYHTKYLGK